MTIVSIALAFVAGIVSFVSPCCLPLVPAYVSYMVGATPADSPKARKLALRHALAFVLGFTIVFVGLWASIGLGIPFILVAVGATAANAKLAWFRRHEAGVSLVTGAMLVLVGFLMITNLFAKLSGSLPRIGI